MSGEARSGQTDYESGVELPPQGTPLPFERASLRTVAPVRFQDRAPAARSCYRWHTTVKMVPFAASADVVVSVAP